MNYFPDPSLKVFIQIHVSSLQMWLEVPDTLTLYQLPIFCKNINCTFHCILSCRIKCSVESIHIELVKNTFNHFMYLILCFANIKCNNGSIVMFTLQQFAAQYSGATADIDSIPQFMCEVFNEIFWSEIGEQVHRNVRYLNMCICQLCLFCLLSTSQPFGNKIVVAAWVWSFDSPFWYDIMQEKCLVHPVFLYECT